MSGRGRAAAAMAGWTGFLLGAVVLLHAVGGGVAAPPLAQPGEVLDWARQRQPDEAVVAVLRLAGLGIGWYLLVVTAAALVAHLLRLARLAAAVDALTVPAVRRLLATAMGLSISTASLTGSVGTAWAADDGPPVETMRRLPDDAAVAQASPPVTMRRLPQAPAVAVPGPAPAGPAPAPGRPSWTVRPGDHFWAVAERVLAEAWQRNPSDAEVSSYWRALIAANHDRLRDRRNPDLLFPGQVLVVPAPPARPA